MSSTDPATGQISPPDSQSIQTFFGVKKSGNTFTKVAEKLPPGPDGHWYRRSIPLTVRLFASSHRVAVAHPSCTLRRPLRSLAMLLLPMPLTLPTLEVTTARTSTHSRPPPPSSRDRERERSASCSTRFRCESNPAREGTCSDITRPLQENDGVLGSNLQTTVANVLTIVSSLIGPALQALGCPAAGT